MVRIAWMPILIFGALLFSRAHVPRAPVFDEVTYVPAIKALITFQNDLNWVHPPLAKLIPGVSWLLLTRLLNVIAEPTVFRCPSIVFGLWALWGVRAWMLALGYTERDAQLAVWFTGFNFIWFVQSKTAMLDVYFVAFGIWGALAVWRERYWRGWALLGLALACKWSALPLMAAACAFQLRDLLTPKRTRYVAMLAVPVVYVATFLPLSLLDHGAVHIANLIDYHRRMLRFHASISAAAHPYVSRWWQWPTLLRPMWYSFGREQGVVRCIWAGGNPVLYWSALPLLFVIGWEALRTRNAATRVLGSLFWLPLLFCAAAPRRSQYYYYYLPSSMWVGPIVVWAHERFREHFPKRLRQRSSWVLFGFLLLCGASFLYFLPIMDARLLPFSRYVGCMWLKSWI